MIEKFHLILRNKTIGLNFYFIILKPLKNVYLILFKNGN
jgi:hypothetical protein